MAYFETKNPDLGNFGGSCNGRLVYDMAIWFILQLWGYILWPFSIFHGYLVYFFPVLNQKIWQPWQKRLFYEPGSVLSELFFLPFSVSQQTLI
jgi:hypothetical protein